MSALGPALGWAAFGVLHSALASRSGTALLQRAFGRVHRLAYNAVASITLAPLLVWSLQPGGRPLFHWEGPLEAVRILLLAGAALLFLAGGRHFRLGQFLGTDQLRGESGSGLGARGRLDVRGVLGVIRHPWYAGTLLLIWSRDLDRSALASNLVLTAYVVVGTLLEERKLVAEFGEAYREHQRRVSMFVPLKWLAARSGLSRLP
jgi:protein-S-isoprenylcysteine O-methyltransferase Ste14